MIKKKYLEELLKKIENFEEIRIKDGISADALWDVIVTEAKIVRNMDKPLKRTTKQLTMLQ